MARNIKPLPIPLTRFTGDSLIGLYLGDEEVTTYAHDTGQLAADVQGPAGTPCEIVQTAAPSMSKLVAFDVIRLGLLPLIPGPESGDSNQVYLQGEVNLRKQLTLDGKKYVYQAWGWYLYTFKRPLTFGTDPLPLGSNVIDRTDPAKNVLPAAAFVDRERPLQGRRSPGDDRAVFKKLAPAPPRP